MIEPDSVNVTDLAILRPKRTGPGGDSDPAQDTVVAQNLRACVHRDEHVIRKAHGVEITTTAIYFLDPGPEVREMDLLTHTDPNGRLIARREVKSVSYAYAGPELDHIEIHV